MNNVITLESVRNRLKIDAELSPNRKPLYVSHATGKVTGASSQQDFGTGLARIRASLDKINRLMAELKDLSNEKS